METVSIDIGVINSVKSPSLKMFILELNAFSVTLYDNNFVGFSSTTWAISWNVVTMLFKAIPRTSNPLGILVVSNVCEHIWEEPVLC